MTAVAGVGSGSDVSGQSKVILIALGDAVQNLNNLTTQ